MKFKLRHAISSNMSLWSQAEVLRAELQTFQSHVTKENYRDALASLDRTRRLLNAAKNSAETLVSVQGDA